MDGWMDSKIDGWTFGWLDIKIDGWTFERLDGWTVKG
jgi:hypothetical protein